MPVDGASLMMILGALGRGQQQFAHVVNELDPDILEPGDLNALSDFMMATLTAQRHFSNRVTDYYAQEGRPVPPQVAALIDWLNKNMEGMP